MHPSDKYDSYIKTHIVHQISLKKKKRQNLSISWQFSHQILKPKTFVCACVCFIFKYKIT